MSTARKNISTLFMCTANSKVWLQVCFFAKKINRTNSAAFKNYWLHVWLQVRTMQDATWREILDRLILASGSANETALASRLGISNQSIYNAKSKRQVPPSWVYEIAKTFSVSADWLFFGRGSMLPGEIPQPAANAPETPVNALETANCARCTKMETELELERQERRELTQENRQLNAENRQLAREIGELKTEVAIQRERLKSLSGKSVDADVA